MQAAGPTRWRLGAAGPALFACALIAGAPLSAQEGEVGGAAPAGAAAAADSAVALDALVVEALRLPTAVREATFAVSSVGIESTRAGRAGRGLSEALHGVPGLQVSDRQNDALGERLVIRGFGARAAFGVRGVRVLIDGIPATLPDGQTDLSRLDMATIGRVEILRGPASSLYGNASGGVVRITSARPPATPFAPAAEALVGADGARRLHARVTGRAGDGEGAWWDASATHRTNDGFRDHSASDRAFARAAGGLRVAGGDLRLELLGVTYDARNPGSLSTEQLAEDRAQAHSRNVEQRTGERADQALAAATWSGLAGPGTLELALYGTARALENPIPGVIIDLDRSVGGGRVVYGATPGGAAAEPSSGAGLELLAGAEFDVQRDDRRNFVNEAGARGALALDQLEHVRALGVFAVGRLPLGSRVDASAGLRYDRVRFSVADRFTAGDPDDSGARVLDALSPSLGVHVRVAPSLHVYANAATAFETPTTTELANRPDGAGGFNPQLEPQRVLSLESGARGAVHALGYEVAVYRARIRDALVPFEVGDGSGRQYFRNAGSATHRGVEAALRLDGPHNLRWRAAWTWIDARFDDFVVDGESYAGNRVPGIAPRRFDASVAWHAARWLAALEATHAAPVPVDDANSAEAGGYLVLDARAEWRIGRLAGVAGRGAGDARPGGDERPGGRATLRLFGGVRNILDEPYIGSVVVNAFGQRYFEPAPGRSVYVGVRAGLE